MSSRAIAPRNVVEIRPSRGLFDLDLIGLWRYRELWSILMTRDIKVRYRQAALGVMWAIVQPVLPTIISVQPGGHWVESCCGDASTHSGDAAPSDAS